MIASYHLRRWNGYVTYKDILNNRQRKEAGQFFRAIQKLEKDEIRLLHEKYVTTDWVTFDRNLCVMFNNRSIPDEILAKKHHKNLDKYRFERRSIERKLQRFMIEEKNKSDEKEAQGLDQFIMIIGDGLYLKSYEVSPYFSWEVKEVTVTPNDWEAVACSLKDEALLSKYGFKRRKIR